MQGALWSLASQAAFPRRLPALPGRRAWEGAGPLREAPPNVLWLREEEKAERRPARGQARWAERRHLPTPHHSVGGPSPRCIPSEGGPISYAKLASTRENEDPKQSLCSVTRQTEEGTVLTPATCRLRFLPPALHAGSFIKNTRTKSFTHKNKRTKQKRMIPTKEQRFFKKSPLVSFWLYFHVED